MSTEDNKSVVRAVIEEIWNRGNLDAVERYFADDYVDHNHLPGQALGREGYKQAVAAIRSAFPDLRLSLQDIIAEGDRVAFRYTMSGTHRGQFMGIPRPRGPFRSAGCSSHALPTERPLNAGPTSIRWFSEVLVASFQQWVSEKGRVCNQASSEARKQQEMAAETTLVAPGNTLR